MPDFSASNPLVAPEEVAQWLAAVPRPVAVTGGTGFVGSHLVDALCAAGVRPRVLVRDPRAPRWIGSDPVEWVPGGLEDRQALARLVDGAGTVLHLAGVLRAGRRRDFEAGNQAGTAAVAREVAARAPAARLVHVSSLAAAGPSPAPDGVGPEVEPAPVSWYGHSKLAAERELRSASAPPTWCIVRPPAIYGPRDTDIFEFFRMASRGVVAIPGGERWLTVAWVGDVVRSIFAAAVASPGSVFHVGDPLPLRIDELVTRLCRAGGVRARVLRLPTGLVSFAGTVGSGLQRLGWRRVAMTADKSRELLARHWTSRTADSLAALGVGDLTPFEEGAERTWEWYRALGWLR